MFVCCPEFFSRLFVVPRLFVYRALPLPLKEGGKIERYQVAWNRMQIGVLDRYCGVGAEWKF